MFIELGTSTRGYHVRHWSTLLCWRRIWCFYGHEDTVLVSKRLGLCHADEVWDKHRLFHMLAVVIVCPKVVVDILLIMTFLKATVPCISVVVAPHIWVCSLLHSHDIDASSSLAIDFIPCSQCGLALMLLSFTLDKRFSCRNITPPHTFRTLGMSTHTTQERYHISFCTSYTHNP